MLNIHDVDCRQCEGEGMTEETWGDYSTRVEGCTACQGSGKAAPFEGRLLDLDAAAWPSFGLNEECGASWPLGMRGVSNGAYHAHKAASSSELKHALRSFDHYRAARSGELERENSAALNLGTAAHVAILEPERVSHTFAVKLDGRTTAGKDQAAQNAALIAAGGEGLMLLSQTDIDTVMRMADQVWRHPAAASLLSLGGEVETSWVSQVDGFPVRVRPDFLGYGGQIVDLKTCQDASPSGFARSAAHWLYHMQAALYADVLWGSHTPIETQSYYWLAVEKTAPYAVGVYTLELPAWQIGRSLYRDAFDTIGRALKEPTRWRGYDPDPQPLVLPRWA